MRMRIARRQRVKPLPWRAPVQHCATACWQQLRNTKRAVPENRARSTRQCFNRRPPLLMRQMRTICRHSARRHGMKRTKRRNAASRTSAGRITRHKSRRSRKPRRQWMMTPAITAPRVITLPAARAKACPCAMRRRGQPLPPMMRLTTAIWTSPTTILPRWKKNMIRRRLLRTRPNRLPNRATSRNCACA